LIEVLKTNSLITNSNAKPSRADAVKALHLLDCGKAPVMLR
jgi:hypothetical protein